MSDRITEKQLQYLVDRINELTNSPLHTWVRQPDGKLRAQIGNYHLSGARRKCLQRVAFAAPLGAGHVSKRELYNAMRAFIAGLEHREVQV